MSRLIGLTFIMMIPIFGASAFIVGAGLVNLIWGLSW